MADERGDSRVSSFLVGFLVGSLLAGGGAAAYFLIQERDNANKAGLQMLMVVQETSRATKARHLADAERRAAEAERVRAEAEAAKPRGK